MPKPTARNKFNLMTPADFLRWAKNADCLKWEDFGLLVFSVLVVQDTITAFWKKNWSRLPVQWKGEIRIRSMIGAGLEVLTSWEGLAKWRRTHPSDLAWAEKLLQDDRWQTLLDFLPLPG